MFDRTLLEAIEEGIVPRPGLLTYQDWNSWRARDGQRPSKRRHGDDERTTTTAEEAQLWRTVMEALYGPEWKDQLAVAGGALEETEEEEEEEEERPPTTLARAPEGGVRAAQGAEPPGIGPGGPAASSTVGGESSRSVHSACSCHFWLKMVSCDSGFTAALQSKVVARLSSSRQCDKGDLWAGEVRLAGPHFWFARPYIQSSPASATKPATLLSSPQVTHTASQTMS